ncbi:class I SAM-dependent methyltransferase [Streptomyces sp. NPDC000229]|uniref:class I SAM-dependent methyltransferase n=1 Tax=Streptomyces sp. NPDC000229 TaxID=3154247 RepID=UPI00331BC2F0
MAAGVARFTEPRRADCPWCGSTALAVLLSTSDRLQAKPGRFTLEECQGCGHVFQNPRLTQEGLDFYYRDFYDGHGEALWDFNFRRLLGAYRGRVGLCAAHGVEPTAWLDVGAGHGHFCDSARSRWPHAVFDGLDQGDGIERGVERGWLDQAHRGRFTDLAGELAGRYDVVSMHHYLEHTRDPYAELDAAARVLEAGGHLLIEVPDPQWPVARRLGRHQLLLWNQPQHQHLIPDRNLIHALEARDFEVVAVQRGAAHMWGAELASLLFFTCIQANPRAPWKPEPSPWRRWGAWPALMVGAALAMPAAVAFDSLCALAARLVDRSNTYRVLARKRAHPAAPTADGQDEALGGWSEPPGGARGRG